MPLRDGRQHLPSIPLERSLIGQQHVQRCSKAVHVTGRPKRVKHSQPAPGSYIQEFRQYYSAG